VFLNQGPGDLECADLSALSAGWLVTRRGRVQRPMPRTPAAQSRVWRRQVASQKRWQVTALQRTHAL